MPPCQQRTPSPYDAVNLLGKTACQEHSNPSPSGVDSKDVQEIILQEILCLPSHPKDKDAGYQTEDWGAPNRNLALSANLGLQVFAGDVHIPPQG
jgi:hypothetical protein